MLYSFKSEYTFYFAGPQASGNKFGGLGPGSERQRDQKLPYNIKAFVLVKETMLDENASLYTAIRNVNDEWHDREKTNARAIELRPFNEIITPEQYAAEMAEWDVKVGTADADGLVWEKELFTRNWTKEMTP